MREQEEARGVRGEGRGEGEGEGEAEEPAHHARRPMNAFLIFCKRHRAVVRDKYPNLENRSITKILGEWWANLDEEEKACYTGLAKQYKDAFFSANPDFKWYKLPAPPLRTLSSRPAAASAVPAPPAAPADKPSAPPAPHPRHYPPEPLRTNNNTTKYDYNRRYGPAADDSPLSMFTPGKLADEAHMGGISSLLSTNPNDKYGPKPEPGLGTYPYSPYSVSTPIPAENQGYRGESVYSYRSQYSDKPKGRSREDDILALQNALSETTRIFEDFDDNPKLLSFDNNNQTLRDNNFTNQEIINEIVDRRLMKDEMFNDDSHKTDYSESDKISRSGRSCKGKRYQEFMSVGGLLTNKRTKREDTPEEYNASCSWEYSGQTDESLSNGDNRDGSHRTEYEMSSESDKLESPDEPPEAKPFKPADFDLDAKIKALPSLSLEKFQERKRESKKKKRSGFSVKARGAERRGEAEVWREAAIGSQKRKPRKISITRLEVHSMVNRSGEAEVRIAAEAPRARLHELARHASAEAGLLALATLAEVAACTSKLDSSAAADAAPHLYRVGM